MTDLQLYSPRKINSIWTSFHATLREARKRGTEPAALMINPWEWGLMGFPARCFGKPFLPDKRCQVGKNYWVTKAGLKALVRNEGPAS